MKLSAIAERAKNIIPVRYLVVLIGLAMLIALAVGMVLLDGADCWSIYTLLLLVMVPAMCLLPIAFLGARFSNIEVRWLLLIFVALWAGFLAFDDIWWDAEEGISVIGWFETLLFGFHKE
jgi:hypothetical protein